MSILYDGFKCIYIRCGIDKRFNYFSLLCYWIEKKSTLFEQICSFYLLYKSVKTIVYTYCNRHTCIEILLLVAFMIYNDNDEVLKAFCLLKFIVSSKVELQIKLNEKSNLTTIEILSFHLFIMLYLMLNNLNNYFTSISAFIKIGFKMLLNLYTIKISQIGYIKISSLI